MAGPNDCLNDSVVNFIFSPTIIRGCGPKRSQPFFFAPLEIPVESKRDAFGSLFLTGFVPRHQPGLIKAMFDGLFFELLRGR